MPIPSQPISLILSKVSSGAIFSWSHFLAYSSGTCSRTKRRTESRNINCSSVKLKSAPARMVVLLSLANTSLNTSGVMVIQGREPSTEDIGPIQELLAEQRDRDGTRRSHELGCRWDWRNARGRIKHRAARTPLSKLERGGHIGLWQRR